MKKRILLDTDIGSDIDDALCLAYLLSQPDCELLGITTVSGEPEKRAMLASAICKQAKKEIPIYPGIDKPLLVKQLQPLASQHNRIAGWEHETQFPRFEAIRFLQETIRNNPGEISLLAIGPMTNIAVLFTIDPEIPLLLKELILMCGKFENKVSVNSLAEWNAKCDPHAAAVVYGATPKIHRSIGLDVTLSLVMCKEEMQKHFHADVLKPVVDFAEEFFSKNTKMVFHDPLASAVMFDESICEFKRGMVGVELKSDRLMGLTHWDSNPTNGPHEYASEVNVSKFFEHYFGVIDSYAVSMTPAIV